MFWGLTHIIHSAKELDEISQENKLIYTLEWRVEGIAFLFIGLLVIAVTSVVGTVKLCSVLIYLLSSTLLLTLTLWSLFKGYQSKKTAIRMSPFIKLIVASMYLWVALS
ncbi:MAG: hypothetical protein JW995_10565 [Melioribacteraceae bacterium]|nr:hypothetical protein [Melioribacteraceae bacterium]